MVAVRRRDLGIDKALWRLGAVKIFPRHQGEAPGCILAPERQTIRWQPATSGLHPRRAPARHHIIDQTRRDTSGRAASWISTKSGASPDIASSPSAPQVLAHGAARDGSGQIQARPAPQPPDHPDPRPIVTQDAKLPAQQAEELHRPAQHRHAPAGIHTAWAGWSRRVRPFQRQRSGRQSLSKDCPNRALGDLSPVRPFGLIIRCARLRYIFYSGHAECAYNHQL